jgi:hypothetical protein
VESFTMHECYSEGGSLRVEWRDAGWPGGGARPFIGAEGRQGGGCRGVTAGVNGRGHLEAPSWAAGMAESSGNPCQHGPLNSAEGRGRKS